MSIARCESRLRQSRGALALAWFGLAGCGAELDPEGVDFRSQSLTFPTNQWATWTEPSGQQFETWIDSPALCTTPDQGIVFVGVRQATAFSRRYRLGLNKWRLSSDPDWASLGTRSFNSKPACTSLDPDISNNSAPYHTHQFVVLGRSTDNRFYAQTMQVDTSLGDWPNDPPEQPAENVKVAWHSISDDLFSSAPAATAYYGWLVVAGRNGNRIHLHRNALDLSDLTDPYSSSAWEDLGMAPALPSPWSPVGSPAIATDYGRAVIMTRAAASGQRDRIYQIYWDGWHGNSHFYDGVTYNGTSWTSVLPNSTLSIYSDPALMFDYMTGNLTLVVRGRSAAATDSTLFNTTGLTTTWDGWRQINAGTQKLSGHPAGAFGPNERCYVVLARNSADDKLLWTTPPISAFSCP